MNAGLRMTTTNGSRFRGGGVQLGAFDILAIGGDDLRQLPLSMRKTNLARFRARRPERDFRRPVRAGWDRS
jgi:ATP-dependent DNA ligase